jgi:hypothetical protein
MAKRKLQDPVTGRVVYVNEADVVSDGPAGNATAPDGPQERAPAGPVGNASAPGAPRETQRHGPAGRARRPMDSFDTFFDGDGIETVDREDL